MGDTSSNSIQWELYQKVCDKLKESENLDKLSETFGGLKSDEERVKFVLDLGVVEKIVCFKPCYTPKSSSKANDFRIEGNQLFKNKHFLESLEKYNQSILFASEDDTKTTALAYANRSAVLFHLGEYDLSLKDIQTSLDSSYPEEIMYKVLDRKGRCYKLLGRTNEANSAFNEAIKKVEISHLPLEDKMAWKKELEIKLKHCSEKSKNGIPTRNLDVIRNGFPALPQVININDKYIAASKAFDIKILPSKGRYPVAAWDIDIGEVLVVEKPFASVLLQECQTTHCHNCLHRTIAPLPCKQCSAVRYCSLKCAEQSWKMYHSFECKYLDHIYRAGKYGHLALRTLLVAGFEQCRDVVSNAMKLNDTNTDLNTVGFNSAGVYDPSEYTPIYNLVGHTELRTVGDLFRRAVIAVYLLKCVQQTNFFLEICKEKTESGNIDNIFVTAGGKILRHLQSFPCNAHEISELQLSLKSVQTSVTMEIGAGIYATMSLFNHSCEPNVTRFFYGDKCVVRALRSITTGQEIADNYGVLSALTPRDERQNTLASQYYFSCNCQACAQDAPLFTQIAKIQHPTLRCDYCGFALPQLTEQQNFCLNCNAEQDISFKMKLLNKSEQRLKEAVDNLFHANVANSLPQIQSHLRILEKNVLPPWSGFNSCNELMKQCYNILANCHVVD